MSRRSWLAVLVLALVAPAAVASVPQAERAAAPTMSSAATLERALASDEPSGFALDLGSLDQPAPCFAPLVGVKLIEDLALESHQAVPSSLSETRVGVFQFLGTPLVGVQRGVTLEVRWPSARFSLGLTPGSREDPLGLQAAPSPYCQPGVASDSETASYMCGLTNRVNSGRVEVPRVPASSLDQGSLMRAWAAWLSLGEKGSQAGKGFWRAEPTITQDQRDIGADWGAEAQKRLGETMGDLFGAGIGATIKAGQTIVETEVGGRLVRVVLGAGGKVVRISEELGSAGDAAARGAENVRKGRAGEEAVSKAIDVPRNAGPGRATVSGTGKGKFRIPDFDPSVTIRLRGSVVEVKNLKSLSMTPQLRDLAAYARQQGAVLEIFTNAPAPTRGELADLITARQVRLVPIS